MSRGLSHAIAVGNDFVLPSQSFRVLDEAEVISQPIGGISSVPIESIPHQESIPVNIVTSQVSSQYKSSFSSPLNFAHRYSLGTFAVLLLIVGAAGIEVAGHYWTAQILAQTKPIAATRQLTHTIPGPSLTVPHVQLQSELQKIGAQTASLAVGTQTVQISPATIKSWLHITASGSGAQDYIQVNTKAVDNALSKMASQFVVDPINQVTVTHSDGVTPSGVVVAGVNGTSLSNAGSITSQSQQSAKSIMSAQGIQFSTPLQTVPFQAVTPAAFSKLLETDVNTHRLYAYENGQLVNSFLVTAGAPDDPTPLGEFHIWNKLTSQTMTGFNPNGTKYIQPNVPWINYFDHSGDAVHGNYWRPASVFGYVNTSHGCVGVPVSQAAWIFNWAPIGTTVINHI